MKSESYPETRCKNSSNNSQLIDNMKELHKTNLSIFSAHLCFWISSLLIFSFKQIKKVWSCKAKP